MRDDADVPHLYVCPVPPAGLRRPTGERLQFIVAAGGAFGALLGLTLLAFNELMRATR